MTVFKLTAEVAMDAVPVNEAVIVPAEKLPELSLKTIVEAVLLEVAFESIVNVVPSPADPIVDIPFPDVATVPT